MIPSSTITAILYVYAERHNRSVGILRRGLMAGHQFDFSRPDDRERVRNMPRTTGGVGPPFDLWVNHALFSATAPFLGLKISDRSTFQASPTDEKKSD